MNEETCEYEQINVLRNEYNNYEVMHEVTSLINQVDINLRSHENNRKVSI